MGNSRGHRSIGRTLARLPGSFTVNLPGRGAMIYQFEAFELDDERYELRNQGEVVAVEPLVFDLITHLVRHPGQVLTRDDMLQVVWRGRVVSDATIATCVKSARRALDDTGSSQRLIKTVRGRGFQFDGAVQTRSVELTGSPPSALPIAGRASAMPETQQVRRYMSYKTIDAFMNCRFLYRSS